MNEARQLLLGEGVDLEGERLVVIFPGASNAIRMWPAERFAALTNRIAETYRTHILICGAPSDHEIQEAGSSKMSPPVVPFAGRPDLLQHVANFKHCGLHL